MSEQTLPQKEGSDPCGGPAMPLRSLKERMAENPDAYTFGSPYAASTAAAVADHEAPSLALLLGGADRPIERKGVLFYPESPLLEDLDAMMDQSALLKDGAKHGQVLIALSTFFLHVDDAGSGERRRATALEIGCSFDLQDLALIKELLHRYVGLALREGEGHSPKQRVHPNGAI